MARARRLALLRLVDGRRFLVALSEAATRAAPAPPVPQGLRRRHPLSCLPHHRQDALVELLGEHLDAIDVSRAGKTVGRTNVLPANPGQLLSAPDSWTVSSVARHGQPPTMHAAYCDLRADVGFFGRYSSGSRYDPIEPPGGKGLGPQTPASHASCTTESVRYRLIWASGRTSEAY